MKIDKPTILDELIIEDGTSGFKLTINAESLTQDEVLTMPEGGGTIISSENAVFTNTVDFATSTIDGASLTIPPGTAPTTPANGDVWTTSTGLFVRINGVTVGPLLDSTGTITNTNNIAITNDVATNATVYPVWVSATSGNQALKVSNTGIYYNPNTATLSVQNLNVLGTTTTIDTEHLLIEDNIIVINKNQIGTPDPGLLSGLEVERGDLTNYQFLFRESDDSFVIGVTGSLQAVATRQDSPTSNGIPFWNNSAFRFDTDADLTYNSTTNTLTTGTVVLSSLTNNGFLKTSSSNGTLIVDTNTYSLTGHTHEYNDISLDVGAIENASTQYWILCRNAANNDVNGRIIVGRTSGNYQSAQLDFLITSTTSAMIGGTLKTTQYTQNSENYRLVTLTLTEDGLSYVAIEYTGNAFPKSYSRFLGRATTTAGDKFLTAVAAAGVSAVVDLPNTGSKFDFKGNITATTFTGALTGTASGNLALSGGTLTGTLILPAGTTSLSPLRIPHGVAHSTPTNGDIWTTTSGLFARINGSTVGPFSATTGTVTSVSGTGSVNGITLSGTVTSSGNITLGGTLGGISNAQLTNSSITIGTTAISLGASSTTLAGLTSVNNVAITAPVSTATLTIGSGLTLAVSTANKTITGAGTSLQIDTSLQFGASLGTTNRVLYTSSAGVVSGLTAGTTGFVLTQGASAPAWANANTLTAGAVANSITFNDAGAGAASGTTFDGSAARTISHNTIGALALSGGTLTGTLTTQQITIGATYIINHNTTASFDKIRVWNSNNYTIGMINGLTFGSINNDYAMTFTMSDTANRGWLFRDAAHTTAQGAFAITTQGKANLAHSLRIGYGESDATIAGATYRLDVNGPVSISGNNYTDYGPNSSWGASLRVGGNGHSVGDALYASVVTTNGNLHLDSANGGTTYINYYKGNSVFFGNGASGTVAVMGPDGDLWKGNTDNTGTQYVYNSGTWGISISGNAATVTNGVYTNSTTVMTGAFGYTNAANRTFGIAATAAGTAGRQLEVYAGDTTADATARNIAGGNLLLSSGQSVGTSTSSIVLQTPTPAGAAGTTLNAYATRVTINSAAVTISNSTLVLSSTSSTTSGAIWIV